MTTLLAAAKAAVQQFGKLTWRDRAIGFREWSDLDDAVREFEKRAEAYAATLCELSHGFSYDSEKARILSEAADFLRSR